MERFIFSGVRESQEYCGKLDMWAQQVSEMIDDFNQTHPNEMLPKTPEVIRTQLLAGESVLVVSPDKTRVLYHGSLYPLLKNEDVRKLGFQVLEFGSWIVPEDCRGRGLGTQGCRLLKQLAAQKWGRFIGLATNKRVIAAMAGIGGGGMTAVNFSDFPHLTKLTCVCSSMQSGMCLYQRGSQDEIVISASSDKDLLHNGRMSCTLLVTDIAEAKEFERTCNKKGYGK